MSSALRAPIRISAASLYVLATFFFGTRPAAGGPVLVNDKVLHALCFLGMVVVLFPALALFARGRPVWLERAQLLAALFALLMGGMLELIQARLPHRRAELADLAADGIGALLGYLVLRLGSKWWQTSPS